MKRGPWVAFGIGAAVSTAANPAIRKGYWQLYWAVEGVIRNRPMEWEDPETGEIAETERMTRRMRWTITRPIWTRRVGAVGLSCGCGRWVTGRMAWYSADCAKHSSIGAYRRARAGWLESADWDDVLNAVMRLTADGPADEVKPTNDRGFLGYAQVTDTNGGEVRVYESSAFMVGDIPGPFVWLNVDATAWSNREGASAAAHLDLEQAGRVVRGLVGWLAANLTEDDEEDG